MLGYALEYSVALAMEFWLSLKMLFGRGFDVIHACNPPDTIFLIGGFYKLFGKKFVFDHHDINPELYEAKFGKRGFGRRLLVALERMSFSTADMVISTNESYRQIAIDRGGKNPKTCSWCARAPTCRASARCPPNPALKQGRKYLVGYVGVMGKQEGIDLLLQAVQLIVHHLKRTDIHFGLVGGGTELPAMRELAKQLGVAEYVTFTGRAPDAELLEMLNTADICVNPDRANDMNDRSTMNKIMEYMALGQARRAVRPDRRARVGRRGVLVRASERRRRSRAEDGGAARRREPAHPHGSHRPRARRAGALLATRGAAPARGLRTSDWRSIMKKFLLACCAVMALARATGAMAQDANYTVKPGDLLSISVWKEPDLQRPALVRPDGSFSFPLVGEIDAKGKTVADLNKTMSQKLAKYISDPVVTVSIQEIKGNKVYVIGQVNKPGEFIMNPTVDVMQALSMAGGTTPFASLGRHHHPAPHAHGQAVTAIPLQRCRAWQAARSEHRSAERRRGGRAVRHATEDSAVRGSP